MKKRISLLAAGVALILFNSNYNLSFGIAQGQNVKLYPAPVYVDGGAKKWGYINDAGKFIIAPSYRDAEDFKDGKAWAVINDNTYALIDENGKVLKTSNNYDDYYNSSYISEEKDGYKIVSVEDKKLNTFSYGVVDKQGNEIIPKKYQAVSYLGEGYFAVAINAYYTSYVSEYIPCAIFNNKGEQLTDFNLYNISNFKNGMASACDLNSTFLIDADGKVIANFPKLKGKGTITSSGDLYKANIDNSISYYDKTGKLMWSQNNSYKLNKNITVTDVHCRVDYGMLIEYPQISGLKNATVQNKINTKFKNLFISQNAKSPKEGNIYTTSLEEQFGISLNKNLLTLEKTGYSYPVGAAHGMPLDDYYHIDMNNGNTYTIKDLFKTGSNYTNKISSIINSQAKQNARVSNIIPYTSYFDNNVSYNGRQGFVIENDALKIYYTPYEIAPYAAGFPAFEIPYGQLSSIINTKGAFWNSFNKTIANSKTALINEVNDKTKNALIKLIGSYEKNLIDSVNKNNFSIIKTSLLPNSSLYNAQQALIKSLSKQNTKEKLVSYQVYAIGNDNADNKNSKIDSYKLFVNETIGIKYKGKSYYTNKTFSYCYTAQKDAKTNTFKLSKIQKW